MKTINIVRREEQVEILYEEGFEYVLNSSDAEFDLDLSAMVREHLPSCYFAAVGGKLVEQVMYKMPPSSTIYLYGNLEYKEITINPSLFIFSKLNLTYLTMFEWMYNLTKEQKEEWIKNVVEDICSEDSVYASHIVKTFNFDQVEEALKYSVENASLGKVILRPFDEN